MDTIMETGYGKGLSCVKLSDREELCSVLIHYHCLLKSKAAMHQFMEGIYEGGITRDLFQKPGMKQMFIHQEVHLTTGH